MNELQQVLATLDEINTRLKYQNRLGLSGGRKYIAIEADKKSYWHYCDDDGTPIEDTILTGYIKRIERRDGDYPKLHIFVEADQEYVLVSGFSTHFSRQAMAAIASMTSQQIALPVIIKPDTGSDDGKTKGKKPVFCNLIQDGRTIRSGQLGTRDAEELYQMAIAVLKDGNTVKPSQRNISSSQSQEVATRFNRVHVSSTPRTASRDYVRSPQQLPVEPAVKTKPPGLDDELPIPTMKTSTAAFLGSDESEGLKVKSVDWKAFCQQHGVFPDALKGLASELGLPHGKLNPSQSAQLYSAAWKRFVAQTA